MEQRNIEQYNLGGKPWASLILPCVYRQDQLIGYIFVIDHGFERKTGKAAKFKMAGGHGNSGQETPQDTAIREMTGEIGFPPVDLEYIGRRLHGYGDNEHWQCLFKAKVPESSIDRMNTRSWENEGEEPEFFTLMEFENLVREGKFLMFHYGIMELFNMIKPIPGITFALRAA